jgi:RecA/RadA recombinase
MDISRIPCIEESSKSLLYSAQLRTVEDLLAVGEVALSQTLGVSVFSAQELRQKICQHVTPNSKTCFDMLLEIRNSVPFLATPLPSLNAALLGGLNPSITEVCGPSAAGKTQFCYSMAALTLMSPVFATADEALRPSVLWIDMEHAFTAIRMKEVLISIYPNLIQTPDLLSASLRCVLLDSISSLNEFLQKIAQYESLIIEHSVKLIVVDSIAALARKEGNLLQSTDTSSSVSASNIERTRILAQIASELKKLAENFRTPVLCINQISSQLFQSVQETRSWAASMHPSASRKLAASTDVAIKLDAKTTEAELIPALGTTWAHCVSTRLYLDRAHAPSLSRELLILKSPCAPNLSIPYFVSNKGVEESASLPTSE